MRTARSPTVPAGDIERALHWTSGRADVVLLAYGPQAWEPRVIEAMRAVHAGGGIVVVSAGNRGPSGSAVGLGVEALVVASVNLRGEPQNYSGRAGLEGVVAPGGDAGPTGDRLLTMGPDAELILEAGTSVSAALVAGVVALVHSANPALTATEIVACIRASATDVGEPGPDDATGYGLVNAQAAVRCTEGPRRATPPTTSHQPMSPLGG